MKLVGCKSALNPTMVYSTDRSKAVVPMSYSLLLCVFFHLCFFSVLFSIAITSPVDERANLSAFRTFV